MLRYVLAALLCAAGTARATTVTNFSVPNDVNAHVTYTPAGVSNLYVMSGQIALTLDGGAVQNSWCTDIYDDLATGAFTVSALTTNRNDIGSALSLTQIGEIGGLIGHATPILASGTGGGGYSLAEVSSATQLAIWSVEYGSGFSFSSDDAKLNGLRGLVATYVADAGNGTFTQNTNVTELIAGGNQGQSYLGASGPVTNGIPVPVPEPSSMMLLASGLIGLIVYRSKAGGVAPGPHQRQGPLET